MIDNLLNGKRKLKFGYYELIFGHTKMILVQVIN